MTEPHKPNWFKDEEILIINSPTCGINKDGITQYKVDVNTGQRSSTEIDDKLFEAVLNVTKNNYDAEYIFTKDYTDVVQSKVLVPQYHDDSSINELKKLFEDDSEFEMKTLGQLFKEGKVYIGKGHGSPSSDQRVGEVPYIKVSDIRAGKININPTNKITLPVAKGFWRGDE